MLLPGYITVILGLVIYYPSFPFFSPSSDVSIDIFSVVVFVVAGPAVGFIQWQIYFHLSSLARFDTHTFNIKYEFQRAYTSLRLVCSHDEREELNLMDGCYIFGFSTAIGLGFVSVYALVVLFATPGIAPCLKLVFDEHSVLCKEDDLQGSFLIGVLIMISIILAVGSYYDNKRSRLMVICNLIEKYKASGALQISTPSTCKRRFRKVEQRQKELAYKIIEHYIQHQRSKQGKGEQRAEDSELVELLDRSDLFQGDITHAKNIVDEFHRQQILDSDNKKLDRAKLKADQNYPPQLPPYMKRKLVSVFSSKKERDGTVG